MRNQLPALIYAGLWVILIRILHARVWYTPKWQNLWENPTSCVWSCPCQSHTHSPQDWLLFCHGVHGKGIVIRTFSTLVLMNYKTQTCNSRGRQESNVLLVRIFSLLMRFFYFKGRPTYSNFEKWRLEIRSLGEIYSSGMPLREVCEEAGLNSEREECYFWEITEVPYQKVISIMTLNFIDFQWDMTLLEVYITCK